MQGSKAFPNINTLSVIMATITLAFSMTRILPEKETVFNLNLGFAEFSLVFSSGTLVALFTAALAATGSQWIISEHPDPHVRSGKWYEFVSHWIIPVFTSFVVSITLNQMTKGNEWWILFGLGAFLLGMVFIAEYNVADVSDVNRPLASIGLIALSFSLFLILAIAVRAASLRLYLTLSIFAFAVLMMTLRTMYLRLRGGWKFELTSIIVLISLLIVAGLHYIPISPIRYGLWVTAIFYALISFFCGLDEQREAPSIYLEPLSMLILMGIIGIFVA